jgi:hypothetical protein
MLANVMCYMLANVMCYMLANVMCYMLANVMCYMLATGYFSLFYYLFCGIIVCDVISICQTCWGFIPMAYINGAIQGQRLADVWSEFYDGAACIITGASDSGLL